MSWEHFGLEYMPVQKKGVEVLVTGLSGADDNYVLWVGYHHHLLE